MTTLTKKLSSVGWSLTWPAVDQLGFVLVLTICESWGLCYISSILFNHSMLFCIDCFSVTMHWIGKEAAMRAKQFVWFNNNRIYGKYLASKLQLSHTMASAGVRSHMVVMLLLNQCLFPLHFLFGPCFVWARIFYDLNYGNFFLDLGSGRRKKHQSLFFFFIRVIFNISRKNQ